MGAETEEVCTYPTDSPLDVITVFRQAPALVVAGTQCGLEPISITTTA